MRAFRETLSSRALLAVPGWLEKVGVGKGVETRRVGVVSSKYLVVGTYGAGGGSAEEGPGDA